MKASQITNELEAILSAIDESDWESRETIITLDNVLIKHAEFVETYLNYTAEEFIKFGSADAEEGEGLAQLYTIVLLIEEENAKNPWRDSRVSKNETVTVKQYEDFIKSFESLQNEAENGKVASPHEMMEFFNENEAFLESMASFNNTFFVFQVDKDVSKKLYGVLQLRRLASIFAKLMSKA